MFRELFVGVLALCFWSVAAIASAQTTLTFGQALKRARSDAPSVRMAKAAVETARAAEQQARGAYLPRFSFEGRGALEYADYPVTPRERVDATALTATGTGNAEWTLIDFGARKSAVSAARATALASAASADESRRMALELTAEAYLLALSSRELVEDGKVTLARRSEEAQSIAALAKAGVRPVVDGQRADIEVIAARYALDIRAVAEQATRAALAVTVGADPTLSIAPSDTPSAELGAPISPKEAVILAIAHRPEVKRAEAALEARTGDADAARAQRFPTLGALVSSTLAHTQVLERVGIDGSTYLASGGLVLRWNGLDATVWRQANVADAATIEAQETLASALLTVRAEAVAAAFAVQQHRAALDQAEQMLTASAVMREAQVERYRAGVASLLELLDAESVEQMARVRRIEASRDYDLSRMRLLSACGVLSQRFAP